MGEGRLPERNKIWKSSIMSQSELKGTVCSRRQARENVRMPSYICFWFDTSHWLHRMSEVQTRISYRHSKWRQFVVSTFSDKVIRDSVGFITFFISWFPADAVVTLYCCNLIQLRYHHSRIMSLYTCEKWRSAVEKAAACAQKGIKLTQFNRCFPSNRVCLK